MTKQCFKCRRVLSFEMFYAHPQMADGRLGKCKECARRDVTENRLKSLDYYREYDRLRFQGERRKSWAADALRAHRQRNPEKAAARAAVARAIRAGRLARRPCEVCGCERSEAHHEDYSRPLDVRWLCRVHHLMHHGRYHDARPTAIAT
jgi:hypothetical protein